MNFPGGGKIVARGGLVSVTFADLRSLHPHSNRLSLSPGVQVRQHKLLEHIQRKEEAEERRIRELEERKLQEAEMRKKLVPLLVFIG